MLTLMKSNNDCVKSLAIRELKNSKQMWGSGFPPLLRSGINKTITNWNTFINTSFFPSFLSQNFQRIVTLRASKFYLLTVNSSLPTKMSKEEDKIVTTFFDSILKEINIKIVMLMFNLSALDTLLRCSQSLQYISFNCDFSLSSYVLRCISVLF